MRISSQICLTIYWLGVLIGADSSFPGRSENPEKQSIRRQGDSGDDRTPEESSQRFSFETDNFEPLVPPDFQLELSRLKIPVAEDLPRRIENSAEESREENENGTDDEPASEEDGREDSPESNHEDNEDDDRNQDTSEDEGNEQDVVRSNERNSEEEQRKEEEFPEYEDYDSPKNAISYHYDESGEEPEEKPKKKRPHVDYEVTETIPHDTKTVRPKQKVYPLPPPCPGAPPPTYPTTEAPSTKMPPPPKPPTFPPAPIFPHFPKIFPDSPPSLSSQDDFLDSYFPTSFMSSSSFPKARFRLPAPASKHPLKRYTHTGKESQKIHKRVATPRVILRYHQPTALVIRKIQRGPPPDRIIIRKPPPVKEVHIHHHHDSPPGQVFHIHKDDDGTVLENTRFKAKVEGQRLTSETHYDSATTGPFAEPPSNLRLPGRQVS